MCTIKGYICVWNHAQMGQNTQPMFYVSEGEVKLKRFLHQNWVWEHIISLLKAYDMVSIPFANLLCTIGLVSNGSPQLVKDWYNFCQSYLLIIWAYKVENRVSTKIGSDNTFYTTYNLCRKKQGSSEQKVPNCCWHLIHKVWVWQYTFILLAAFAERSKDPVNRKSQIAVDISSTKCGCDNTLVYYLQPLQKEARIQWTESHKWLMSSHPQSESWKWVSLTSYPKLQTLQMPVFSGLLQGWFLSP